jgi:GntR family transcriptional regulator
MLEREAPVPLYHQLELQLRAAIEAGRYRSGERLPTEGELQRAYGVSRVTVRTALRRLEEDGLISTQRGRGTFVTSQADEGHRIERNPARLFAFEEDLLRQAGPPRVEVLAVEPYPAPQRIAALLAVEEGTEVLRVRRVGSVGDAPLWVESRYFHPTIAAALSEADLRSASVTALLETMTGLHVSSSRLRITAGAATGEQARHLGLEAGDPVLINEFAVYAAGRPIEAARAVFRADRYAFTVEVLAPQPSTEQALRASLGAGGSFSLIRQEVLA